MVEGRNLGLGCSLNNVIVLDDYRIVNEDGLRYEDELVKHKNFRRRGRFIFTGHRLNRRF